MNIREICFTKFRGFYENCDRKASKNTKQSTETAVKLFKAYLKEKAPALILDEQLSRIFTEMRQSNGEKYKQTTLTVIRHGIKLFNITVTNLF